MAEECGAILSQFFQERRPPRRAEDEVSRRGA